MLKKLLKYDFKSVFKVWWILAVITVAIAFVGSLALRVLNQSNGSSVFLNIFGGFLVVVSVITIALSFTATIFLAAYRFYKNFYSDEGYLTFTLPVKRSTLLLAKTINTFVWSLIGFCVVLISALFFAIFSPAPTIPGHFFNPMVFEFIGNTLRALYVGIGGWLILYIFLGIVALLFALFFVVTLIHFCVTVGSIIAKKYKLLAGIGIYYLTSNAISLIVQLVNFLGVISMADGFSYLLEAKPDAAAFSIFALLLIIVCAAFAVIAMIFYILTQSMIEKKLNLQ